MKRGKQAILRTLLAVATCLMLLAGPLVGSVSAQDPTQTPDPAILDPTLPQNATSTPAPTSEPEETETEPATNGSTPEAETEQEADVPTEDMALQPGAPATLAHGLAYYDGDDLVWQVREVNVPVIARAEGMTAEPGIVVQREGQSIVRNDTTGKRALLNPGDAFFTTSEDSYTIMAEDDGSVIWQFSLVDPDDVAADAFYESPSLTAVRDNTYDFVLVRYVLQPGDSADLPTNNGAGMVMPAAGEVRVDHGGRLSLLGLEGSLGQGQMLRQPTTISNTSNGPSVVYYLFLGDTVTEESSAPPASRQNTANTTGTSTTANPTPQPDGTGSSEQVGQETSGTTETTSPGQDPEDGVYKAQINIYAQTEVYLAITVDGTVWFDGTLPEGRWTGPMVGTNFEVYTTSGANTVFEDACGTQFVMGYEEGEASYALTATATSCPPPGE